MVYTTPIRADQLQAGDKILPNYGPFFRETDCRFTVESVDHPHARGVDVKITPAPSLAFPGQYVTWLYFYPDQLITVEREIS